MKNHILFLVVFITLNLPHNLRGQTTNTVLSKPANKDVPHYDVFAQFPDGDYETYIINHVKFPRNFNREGTGLFSFIIKVDSLGNTFVDKLSFKISPEIDQAFIDVVNKSPKWKPATLSGKPVSIFLGLGFDVDFDKSTGIVKARIRHFSKGPHPVTDNSIFTSVEVPPQFPGGKQAFNDFIDNNIHTPQTVKGLVFIRFVVEKDGTLTNFSVIRAPSDETGKEAKRLLSISPKWIPGMQNGQPVRVAYTAPIYFK